MTLLVLEKVSPSLQGECTRYLIQVSTGVFIGTLNAVVREKLWETVKQKSEGGNCLLQTADKRAAFFGKQPLNA